MKAILLEGDVFDTDCQVICHQVNCMGKMGSGIAKIIRSLYPEVYKVYMEDYNTLGDLLYGSCRLINVSNYNSIRYIANLYGQYSYIGSMQLNEMLKLDSNKQPDTWNPSNGVMSYSPYRYTNYEAFYRGLETLASLMIQTGLTSVAFPYRIGSDRGGADWNIILAMIDSVFSKYNQITVKIYRL